MVRHKLISVKTWLQERFLPKRKAWVVPAALLTGLAAALVAATLVVPMRSLLERQAFARIYATELLASVGSGAVIVVGDTGGPGSGAEIAALTGLQQGKGMRQDVRIVMTDITVSNDDLAAATAAIFREPENVGRPIYLTYAIDQLNPDWHTVATGYLYYFVQEGIMMPQMPSAGTIDFPDDIPERDAAYRGFVALASYRYASFMQEYAGKEAALPHVLRAIKFDEKEQSVTYAAYTARRQVLIDRGGKR
jgi:hypothetical protein